jgi:ketosteroid isomerase-like protein
VSENLDLVRSIYVDWERGDYSSVEWADPEGEWVWADGPEPDRGKDFAEARGEMRDLLRTWEAFHIEVDECRELDDGRIFVLWRYGARGKTSGLDAGQMRERGAHLFELRDCRVRQLTFYIEAKHALADLGLEE